LPELQGIYTAKEINVFLTARGRVDAYPLFHTVHQIAWEGLPPTSVSSKL
jgi:glycerol-3-phosphate dehydrogenase (NAD+)